MKIRLFYHSLASDWNHGNAHFLRGVMTELQHRGHDVVVYEPRNGWSKRQLIADHGTGVIADFEEAFPHLRSEEYNEANPEIEKKLEAVDLVLVHEWTAPGVVAAVGRYRRQHRHLRAFFHDTHHRAVSAPQEIDALSLGDYDGVLAYGAALKDAYLRRDWNQNIFVWHEAADTTIFYPRNTRTPKQDVVWIGNWGDDERTTEINDYFLQPAHDLKLHGNVYGVRYPHIAIQKLSECGMTYKGWTPNYRVPDLFAAHKVTVHIPRGPYVNSLPGIPTIRPFEALSCGIPLVSAPWNDTEHLFRDGVDLLVANDPLQMKAFLADVLHDEKLAQSLAKNGLETIMQRHTCRHRVDELLSIYQTQNENRSLMEDTVGAAKS